MQKVAFMSRLLVLTSHFNNISCATWAICIAIKKYSLNNLPQAFRIFVASSSNHVQCLQLLLQSSNAAILYYPATYHCIDIVKMQYHACNNPLLLRLDAFEY